MKKFLAYSLNAYLLMILVGVIYLSHLVTYEKLALPVHVTQDYPPLPDFESFKIIKEKKAAFFDYFGRIIDDENDRILAQRDVLLALNTKLAKGKTLSQREEKIVLELADRYGLWSDPDEDDEEAAEEFIAEDYLSKLMLRVDIVPSSLALVQAAKESAWGTSRFARKGNNFFGQWCFTEGCGIVPRNRNSGAYHEVRSFPSPAASVRGYLRNINTHRAYRELRLLRQTLRSNDQELSGIALAQGLSRYSERGAPYVAEVRRMIKANKLDGRRPQSDEQLGTR